MEEIHICQSNSVGNLNVYSSPEKESKTAISSRKPLSSICANQSLSHSSNSLKDSVTKSGKKIRQRLNTEEVSKGKSVKKQNQQDGHSNSTTIFGDIFRSISPSKAFIWRDEWNLKPATNINPEESVWEDSFISNVNELFQTDLVNQLSHDSKLNEELPKSSSIQRLRPSEDFWTEEMQDMLTLRIANPINESDDEE